MKGKICLIGASGFIGTKLIKCLGEEHCVNIDKKQSAFYPRLTTIKNICEEGLEKTIPDKTDTVILLAAEHRDNVTPIHLYYDVNLQGTKNVLDAMDRKKINQIIFTSSVAVYGLNKNNPNEKYPLDPFNHYGKSKWEAEKVLREWVEKTTDNRSLTIIRPTVVFGERNRGNVYNLLKQIASGRFLMIGNGKNKKSMAYVDNVVAFIKYCLEIQQPGFRVFNYVDKPDFTMNELVNQVNKSLNKTTYTIRIPYFAGMLGGYALDLLAKISGKKLSVSSVRIKKFCSTTQFDATAAHSSNFKVPYTLSEGLERTIQHEFIHFKKK